MKTLFAANRADALAQWREFLPKTTLYGAQRNYVTPGHAEVSRLSPAIRCRLLLEDEIVGETLQRYPLRKVEKWIQEVCWRRYWKGWLECRPGVWRDYVERLAGAKNERALEVAAGQSGVAVMDHFARELVETGYLHNHARMWFASFWVHIERLPWEMGADFFLKNLLDADAASNTCSWRWVAGLQTPGKTYRVRRSNLEKFCAEELLADATGLERLEEEDRAEPIVPEETADLTVQPLDKLPCAWVGNTAKVGWWIHDEDVLAAESVASIPVFYGKPRTHGAAQQAYREAVLPAEAQDLEKIVDWAKSENLTGIVAYRPFVGPLRDRFVEIEAALAEKNIVMHWLRRESDSRIFPMARKGFFPFWEAMNRDLRKTKNVLSPDADNGGLADAKAQGPL